MTKTLDDRMHILVKQDNQAKYCEIWLQEMTQATDRAPKAHPDA